MDPSPQQLKGEDVLSLLNAAIDAVNVAEVSTTAPTIDVYNSVGVLLTIIRDSMANKPDYVQLGLVCADVCRALNRETDGRDLYDLSQPVCEAIEHLTTIVAEIQGKVIEQARRNIPSRLFHANSDKEAIAIWRLDLNRVLQVFTTEFGTENRVSAPAATTWDQRKAELFSNAPRETTPESTCRVPYEVVEMIIAHLTHDIDALKACSLTCRSWNIVAIPHIQHTLILGRGITPGGLKPLPRLHALGFMPLVKEIRVEQWGSVGTWFMPRAFGLNGLRYFSAFANVHTLKIQNFEIRHFIPGIERYFVHFSALRSITLYDPCGTPRQLTHFLSLFPNLDDVKILRICAPVSHTTVPDGELIPVSEPKLQGRLTLYDFSLVGVWTRMIASYGGLRFRHMDLRGSASCVPTLLEACANTLETLQLYTAYAPFRTHSLKFPEFDLSQLKVLQSLQLRDWTTGFGPANSGRHSIIFGVLATIASPVFSELVFDIREDDVVYLHLEVGFFRMLRMVYGVRPFKLVFLLEVPRTSRVEARRELVGALDWVVAEGLLDFLESPPTIR